MTNGSGAFAMPNDTKINATFMRASSALRGYSKRYGRGDNQLLAGRRQLLAGGASGSRLGCGHSGSSG